MIEALLAITQPQNVLTTVPVDDTVLVNCSVPVPNMSEVVAHDCTVETLIQNDDTIVTYDTNNVDAMDHMNENAQL